jgi:hypothetical protein
MKINRPRARGKMQSAMLLFEKGIIFVDIGELLGELNAIQVTTPLKMAFN